MMNLTLAGHLGADPEERVTPSGQKVVSFRLAVNIRGGGKEETIWWRVTIWGDRFDKMLPYIKKGSGIIVTGRMRPPNIWNDRDGKPQVGLEITAEMIEFLPGKRSQEGGGSEGAPGYSGFSNANTFSSPQQGPGSVHSASSFNAFGQTHPGSASPSFGQGAEHDDSFDEEPLPF